MKIGVVPDYISIQNEPDMETEYESCVLTRMKMETMLFMQKHLRLFNKLNSSMDNPPKILGHEVLGIGYNNLMVI